MPFVILTDSEKLALKQQEVERLRNVVSHYSNDDFNFCVHCGIGYDCYGTSNFCDDCKVDDKIVKIYVRDQEYLKCPEGDFLKVILHTLDDHWCDLCKGAVVGDYSLRCDDCDYDLCRPCADTEKRLLIKKGIESVMKRNLIQRNIFLSTM